MISAGLVVTASDGLYEDGWCRPQVRLSLVATCRANELIIEVWIKPEDREIRQTVFTVMSDRAPAKVQVVSFDQVVPIVIPVDLTEGDVIDLRISTPHLAEKSADERDLSFILSSLALA